MSPPRPPAPAALRSAAGNPTRAPCATCQQHRPAPNPPCDFSKIEIKCGHCLKYDQREIANVTFTFDPATGRLSHNLVRSPNRRRPFVTDRFEVLAGDKVTITVSGGPGFHPGHPLLTLTPPAVNGAPRVLRGTRHEVQVQYEPQWFENRIANLRRMPFVAGLRQFFFPRASPWALEIVACGARPANQKAFKRFTHTIAVYPKDTFKLALSLPSVKKREAARSGYTEGAVRGTTRSSGTSSGWGRTADSRSEETRETGSSYLYRQTESSANRRGGVTQTQTLATLRGRDLSRNHIEGGPAVGSVAGQTARSFQITHNGQDISSSFKIAEFIEFIADLRKQVLGLIEFFKALANRTPRIGWSVSVEVEVCSGSLEYEWGYKEWKKDHTVYKYYKIEVAVTVVTAKVELAFGLELLGAKAQVYGALSGELKISGAREADPDRTGPAATISAAPQVAGEIGVRGALGDWVEVVGKITAGFEGGTQIELAPFAWKAKIELSEGKGTFTARSKLLFSTTRSATLWAKRPIWERTLIG